MRRPTRIPVVVSGAFLCVTLIWATKAIADRLEDTDYIALDHPAINYIDSPLADPVGLLDAKLAKGTAKLDFAPNGLGYLPAILKQLNINIDSQVLVFSHTSIQAARISPRAPRAIYFNDEVAVGFVQNGEVLEFTALDPIRGVRMYVMNASRTAKPGMAQRDDCRQCHQGGITMGVPGMVISSIHPASEKTRDMHGSAFITDQNTPFKERWGGWYVTGTSGAQVHLGNNTELVDPVRPGNAVLDKTQNVTSLADMFDTSRYLAPTSDMVALMTLEHQNRMTNLLVRIGWDARIALYDKDIHDKKEDAEREKLNAEIDEMVRYMLFTEEDQLKELVAGVSTFTKTFPQRGPRDSKGRSLRDFDLQTRLFRYPLSYMIYSAAFDSLPDLVKERVYRRLYDLLTGKEEVGHLSAADRGNIVEILRETKKGLPAYWTANAGR